MLKSVTLKYNASLPLAKIVKKSSTITSDELLASNL